MGRSRFAETQIVSILKEAEAGKKAREICRAMIPVRSPKERGKERRRRDEIARLQIQLQECWTQDQIPD